MDRTRSFILFLALLCGVSFAARAAEQDELKELFLRDLDYVYNMGGDIYSYWELKKEMYGVDWDSLYQNARQQMEEAKNINDYQRIMSEMIASVKDGHVRFNVKGEKGSPSYYMPMRFYDSNGHVIVRKINNGDFMTPPDLALGDEIVSMNGVPIQERIDLISKYISGSTDRMVRAKAISRLHAMIPFEGIASGNPVLGVKKLGEQKIIEVEVPWNVYNYNADPTYADEPWNVTDYVETKILPGNIGYLYVGTMWAEGKMEERQDEFAQYVEQQFLKLLKTDGIIIDVRGNGGGDSYIKKKLIPHMIEDPVIGQSVSYRLSKATMIARPDIVELEPDETTNGIFSKWFTSKFEPVKDGTIYKKRIVLIINSYCFSACDTFVSDIASNKLALVVGIGTGGGTGFPLEFNIPSGIATVDFSTMRGLNAAGKYLEGTGTVPDVEAALTGQDIADGFDSVMSKARDILLEDKGGNTSAVKYMSLAVSGGGKKGFALRDEPILPPSVIEDREIKLTSHEYNGQ